MGAVFSGQALGGIFASGTNVVVLALGATPTQTAFFCFVLSGRVRVRRLDVKVSVTLF